MGERVSWLLIRPGWKVLDRNGGEVGEVDEVAGDSSRDIFDGVAFAATAFGRPLYASAEQVGDITEGAVHLTLSHEEVGSLGEYREPATSLEVEPDSRAGSGVAAEARELEADAVAPIQRREHSMNIWRRIWFFIRRRRGR